MSKYGQLVYTICLRNCGNPFDAEDLMQETFLAAYKGLDSFEQEKEQAWICKIALNKCLDFLKSAGRRQVPTEEVYFEQEMDQSVTTTCIEEIWKEFPSFTQYEVRSALAKCGLTTKHIESMVKVLSGGEQAKVRLCKLINNETNVLLLDEPTNHLDVDAKEELKRALKAYKGSILLICHEPEFYRDVVTDVWNCEDWTTVQL